MKSPVAHSPQRLRQAVALLDLLDDTTRHAVMSRLTTDVRDQLQASRPSVNGFEEDAPHELMAMLLRALRARSPRWTSIDATGYDLEEWYAEERRATCIDGECTSFGHHSPSDPVGDLLAGIPADRLAEFLAGQHPQVVAATLKQLPTAQAQNVLRKLPIEIQDDVDARISTCGDLDSALVTELRCELIQQFNEAQSNSPLHHRHHALPSNVSLDMNDDSQPEAFREILPMANRSLDELTPMAPVARVRDVD